MFDLRARILANPGFYAEINSTYKFEFTDSKENWFFVLKEKPHITQESMPFDCSLSISKQDFMQILQGDLNPQAAFLQGKIKLSGDITLALKLERIFYPTP